MNRWWSSWGKRAAVVAGSILAAAVLFVMFCLWTPPGHAVLGRLVTPLTGGDIVVHGLSGSLPDRLHVRNAEMRDANGVWLRLDGVDLDWHALALVRNRIVIDRAIIRRATVLRPQVRRTTEAASTLAIDARDVTIDRIELDPAVLGRKAVLTARGSLQYRSRHDLKADFAVRRLDGIGRYDVHASIVHDVARGTVTITESGRGIAGGLVGMPDIGPVLLAVEASAEASANTVSLRLHAGALAASGTGTIDLAAQKADVDFTLSALAMHPSPSVSWASLSADGHLHGPFRSPNIHADLKIDGFAGHGVRIETLRGELSGRGGGADLRVTAEKVRLPGANPDLIASSPVVLTAHADLGAPSRPVRFAVSHPLFRLDGTTSTHGPLAGSVALTLPSLVAAGRLAGIDLGGSASLELRYSGTTANTGFRVNGRIAASGRGVLARLLGGDAKLDAAGTVRDLENLTINATLSGAAASARLGGSIERGTRSFEGDVALSDLSRAVGTLVGTLALHGKLNGPADDLALEVTGRALAATRGMARQEVGIAAEARGLPRPKQARLRLAGRFDGSPLTVDGTLAGAEGDAVKFDLERAAWRSAHAQGVIVVSGSRPGGSLSLGIDHLSDLAPLVGQPLQGSIEARADFESSAATVHATAQNLAAGTLHVGHATVSGTIADPFGRPNLSLALSVPQLAAQDVTGSADARLDGTLDALAVSLSSSLTTDGGENVSVSADAVLDVPARHVVVNKFEGAWRDQSVSLASPATVDFSGSSARIAATFVEKKAARLAVNGVVPLEAGQPMNVRVAGNADLGTLTSGLAAVGQSLRGTLAVDFTLTGTPAKPEAAGTATLTDGQLNDYAHGISLTDIEGAAEAAGSTIRLARFTAKAGSGTVTGSGTVDLSQPGMPVNVTFKAEKARPIVSDLMTTTLDSDLKLEGNATGRLELSGELRVREGTINLPQKFPRDVATLEVRRANEAPPPPAPRPPRIGLDVTVSSPGRVFVRGRGIEAEFEGRLKITGSTANPQVLGALTMRRGTLSLAGAELTFQSGKIGFNGSSLRRRLDPTIDFVAQTTANGITATLKVSGTASQPKVELSSSPPLPQDEVLAQLLYQQSVTQLSPLQLAEVAQAIASLGGVGVGFDPVGVMRRSLGLDRLAIGSTPSSNGTQGETTIEAGKYVLHNVYIGARQELSGETRALVQVDLSKHLKAQATVVTGPRPAATTSTPLQDNGDSIGLSYQFEY